MEKPKKFFSGHLARKTAQYFLFIDKASNTSMILFLLQDEVNQIMETNLWLRHVSIKQRILRKLNAIKYFKGLT